MMLRLVLLWALIGLSLQICEPSTCKIPNCRCFNDATAPGDLPKSEIPQIVMVSFEGTINYDNINNYRQIFASVSNPNNCPARGTFFIQDVGSDYKLISSLRIEGHEIGVFSVNGIAPTNSTGWIDAIKQVRAELESVGINLNDVKGVRAPELAYGGTGELIGVATNGMLYDSSCSSAAFSDSNTYLWPYTFDYLPTGSCDNGKQTTYTFPGKWEVPVADLHDISGDKLPCSFPSACRNITSKRDAFDLFFNAFSDHYNGRRTPFLMIIDPAWAADKNKRDGTAEFLQYTRAVFGDNVWIVTIAQALQWVQEPVPVSVAKTFVPWQCN